MKIHIPLIPMKKTIRAIKKTILNKKNSRNESKN